MEKIVLINGLVEWRADKETNSRVNNLDQHGRPTYIIIRFNIQQS
jgi:hypothetical protein